MIALGELRDRYLRAQLAGDRREAVRLLVDDGLGAGATITELQHEVIRGAQDEIGRLWQQNKVTIAQEHMATAISQLSLAALFERARVAAPLERVVLIACVEGELHDLPARLVADFLEIAGFGVRYLGASVPHAHLAAMVREARPDLIGLSVTMSFHLSSLRTAVARVREVSQAPIFAGGHALRWSPVVGDELGVHVPEARPDALLSLARRLAKVTK